MNDAINIAELTEVEDIYRNFCEGSGDGTSLDAAWFEYEDKVGPIESGSLVEKLVLAAMEYALEHHDDRSEASWDIGEVLKPLDIKSPPDWSEYDAYLLTGGTLEYENWKIDKPKI